MTWGRSRDGTCTLMGGSGGSASPLGWNDGWGWCGDDSGGRRTPGFRWGWNGWRVLVGRRGDCRTPGGSDPSASLGMTVGALRMTVLVWDGVVGPSAPSPGYRPRAAPTSGGRRYQRGPTQVKMWPGFRPRVGVWGDDPSPVRRWGCSKCPTLRPVHLAIRRPPLRSRRSRCA